jgi:hypothetical protein
MGLSNRTFSWGGTCLENDSTLPGLSTKEGLPPHLAKAQLKRRYSAVFLSLYEILAG